MNVTAIKYNCTVNGNGVRTAVFVAGCRLHCKGCFNKESWEFKSGIEMTDEIIDKILDSIDKPYIKGLSILGGEPLDENNLDGVRYLIERFKKRFKDTDKDIYIYSGYYFEKMSDKQRDVALMCDYLIDGPFELDKYSKNLQFRGSSNQKIRKVENGAIK